MDLLWAFNEELSDSEDSDSLSDDELPPLSDELTGFGYVAGGPNWNWFRDEGNSNRVYDRFLPFSDETWNPPARSNVNFDDTPLEELH